MAEAINIPSPSVFLRRSPPPSSPPPPAKPSAPKPNVRRNDSAETKKKAPRTASGGTSSGADGSVIKPKQSKSRNGCSTCKAKRLKCGEEKPGCQQCARRNVVCGGYKKDFKWRPFREADAGPNAERPIKRANSPPKQADDSGESSHASPEVATSSQAGVAVPSRPDEGRPKRDSVLTETNTAEERISPRPAKAKRTQVPPGMVRKAVSTIREMQEPSPPLPSPGLQHQVEVLERPGVSPQDSAEAASLPRFSPNFNNRSPTLTEMLMDPGDLDHPELVFEMPDGFQPVLPLGDPNLDDGGISLNPDDQHLQHIPLPIRSRRNTWADIPYLDNTPEGSNDPADYIYPQPWVPEGSPEMLFFRFDRITCGILSIADGPHENPWRTLIWPLTTQSPALYHAIFAMTAFHATVEIPALRIVGHEHKAASIRFIQEGIRDNSMGDQTAIATALCLGLAESWDQHTATGNTHIKGAQALVKRALNRHQQNPLKGDDLARLKFLCNAWVYMDVIARLTSVDSDESHDFDRTFVFSGAPTDCPPMIMGDHEPGFGIDFGMPIDARLDPLMGCASTLFPLIGRVANLVRKVCRSQGNSPALISQANDLKISLEGWDPPAFIERPEDPSTDVQHTLQTAEAYRWATLLHLHASVTELPSLSSAELAQRVLQYLATIPLASRTVIVHIYPLMVAGCEASTEEDRDWVRGRWQAMASRMRIGIIDKCIAVAEEVWRRRDNYEAQPLGNRKLIATAKLDAARTRGQPLLRTPGGSLRPGAPGRTGMVFTWNDEQDSENEVSGIDEKEREQKRRARDRRRGRDPRMGLMDPAYTVRGHLHWVGVMWDWGWEILL